VTSRALLRAATAAEHARVDTLFSRYDLRTPDGYGRFLKAQAAAFLPVEAALDEAGTERWLCDWPKRRRGMLLEADLRDMGITVPEPLPPPAIVDAGSAMGCAYVLEGSRLGGAVLKRDLPVDVPRRFLDAHQEPGSWRKLLANMDSLLYEAAQIDAAVGTAKEVFERFEAGGLRYLETSAA